MKKFVKLLSSVCIALCLCIICTVGVSADSINDYGIDITVNASKDEYSKGEKVDIFYKVSNTNIAPIYNLSNITVETEVSSGLKELGIKETVQKINDLKYGFEITNKDLGFSNNGSNMVSKTVLKNDVVSDEITFSEVNDLLPVTVASQNNTNSIIIYIIAAVGFIGLCIAVVLFAKKRALKGCAVFLVFLLAINTVTGIIPANASEIQSSRVILTETKNILVDGNIETYTVKLSVNDFYVNKDIIYYDDITDTSVISDNHKSAVPSYIDTMEEILEEEVVMRYISNGKIKLGANLAAGGSITYLASVEGGVNANTNNIVNNYDLGRQIQLSIYSGPHPYYVPGKELKSSYATLGFNPIQAGDAGDFGSRVIAFYQTDDFMYIKTRPNIWPCVDAPAQCTFEFTYALVDNRVDVQYRVNMERKDYTQDEIEQICREQGISSSKFEDGNNERQYPAGSIESPAIYVNQDWFVYASYQGTAPFTNDDIVKTTKINVNGATKTHACTENWAALLNTDGYGLGVYTPDTTSFTRAGNAPGNAFGDDRGKVAHYLCPHMVTILDYNCVYNSSYSLILGTVEEIREAVYTIHGENDKNYSVDFTDNDRHNWNFGSSWGLTTFDKGYGKQDCIDFDISKDGSTFQSYNIFFRPQDNKTMVIDAAFNSEENLGKNIVINVGFVTYSGADSSAQPTEITTNAVAIASADGNRRKYEIKLDDYYGYMSAAGVKKIILTFSGKDSDVNAKIYSISTK